MTIKISFRSKKIVAIAVIVFIFVLVFNLHYKARKYQSSSDFIYGDPTKPRLAIVVPFRDRFDELLSFVPYICKFLIQQNIGPFKIHILNQSARYRFNRGALANVGYLLVKNESDYIAIHDVDLVPLNKNLSYSYPEQGPYHLTAPKYHPNYNYDKYFGGILLIKNEHFAQVNGFSNKYFGWGLEDDEFYTRIKAAKLPVFRPENLDTNTTNTFLHFHHNRKRDTFKTKEQREALKYRDRVTGVNNLKFLVTSSHRMTIDEIYSFTVYNVELRCDIQQTPWCLPTYGKSHEKQQSATSESTSNTTLHLLRQKRD